jgi:hypothetical protein
MCGRRFQMGMWFYLIDDAELGPIGSKELKALANAGVLKPLHRVRKAETAKWYFANQVKGLFPTASSDLSSEAPAAASSSLRESGDKSMAASQMLVVETHSGRPAATSPFENSLSKAREFGTRAKAIS